MKISPQTETPKAKKIGNEKKEDQDLTDKIAELKDKLKTIKKCKTTKVKEKEWMNKFKEELSRVEKQQSDNKVARVAPKNPAQLDAVAQAADPSHHNEPSDVPPVGRGSFPVSKSTSPMADSGELVEKVRWIASIFPDCPFNYIPRGFEYNPRTRRAEMRTDDGEIELTLNNSDGSWWATEDSVPALRKKSARWIAERGIFISRNSSYHRLGPVATINDLARYKAVRWRHHSRMLNVLRNLA
ncbi:hypothetical protein T439DRAFT_351716 [Meredithblackwellia eburnea MCA 4105]